MKFFVFLLSILLSACVSQSTYQQSLQVSNEAIGDKERYIRELAQARRELNKLKDEYNTFQTVSQTVLEDNKMAIETQKLALEKLNDICNEKIATLEKNASKNCENYKNAAQKWQEQENYNKTIAIKNQNTAQELRDSLQSLDLLNINIEIAQQKVYLRAQELAFFKKEGRLIEKNGRDILMQLTNYLRRSPDLYVYILVYHQTAKTADENWKIANSRAQNLVLFLQSQQINPTQLFATAHIATQNVANQIEIILSNTRIF